LEKFFKSEALMRTTPVCQLRVN